MITDDEMKMSVTQGPAKIISEVSVTPIQVMTVKQITETQKTETFEGPCMAPTLGAAEYHE